MSHHYGETATTVKMGRKNLNITFTNEETGAVVRLTVPLKGSMAHGPGKLTVQRGQRLADEVAHILRQVLD